LAFGLVLTVASSVRVFIFLPPRVSAIESAMVVASAEMKMMQTKATGTELMIARIEPQLAAISQVIQDIKADVRDIRNSK